MKVAIMSNGVCINIAVFNNLETAEGFLNDGAWPNADTVTELPEGYGIGDTYDGQWVKKAQPEQDEPEAQPQDESVEAQLAAMQAENVALMMAVTELYELLIGG